MSFWRKQPLLKGYVSEIDRFLQEFDRRPDAYSSSRRLEEAKVYHLIAGTAQDFFKDESKKA